MEFGQNMRRHWRDMRARAADAHARAADAANEHLDRAEFLRQWRWSTGYGIAAAVVVVIFLIYPLAAWFDSSISDDPNFTAPIKAVTQGKSHAVANAVALINREVKKNGWSANAPWFWPTALLDDMPNYQKGIIAAVGHFTLSLSDEAGRAHGADADLQSASGLLQYPPDVWFWDPSVSIWPTATSASQYSKAARSLRTYNTRLAAHQAALDTSAASLAAILERMAADLDSSSAAIQDHIEQHSGWPFDTVSDDVFYRSKGQLYADYIVLKGLQVDFSGAIAQHNLQKPWVAMMQSFRDAIAVRPWFVMNGAPDSALFGCTLCGEGFYLSRATAQLREIKELLQQ